MKVKLSIKALVEIVVQCDAGWMVECARMDSFMLQSLLTSTSKCSSRGDGYIIVKCIPRYCICIIPYSSNTIRYLTP